MFNDSLSGTYIGLTPLTASGRDDDDNATDNAAGRSRNINVRRPRREPPRVDGDQNTRPHTRDTRAGAGSIVVDLDYGDETGMELSPIGACFIYCQSYSSPNPNPNPNPNP